MEGNTAPSGYSAGASEEQNRQVAGLVTQLTNESLVALLPASTLFSCDRAPDLRHAALAQPTSFRSNNDLGLFYLQHGEPQLGSRYLQIAAEIQPRDRENLLHFADADLEARQYASVLHVVDSLLQINDKDAVAYGILGVADAGMGKSRDALVQLKRSLELNPSEAVTYTAGLVMLSSGSLADAESSFVTGTGLYPGSANLWLGRGIAEILNGMKSQAIASLLKASEFDPARLLPYTLLASQAGGAPPTDQSIVRRVEQLVKEKPDQAIAHYDYALVLSRTNESPSHALTQQIESELKTAIDQQQQLAAAHYELGVVYSEAGTNTLAAIAELARANLLEPGVAEWHYRLARAYRKDNQFAASDQQMQTFAELKSRRDAGEDVSANLLEGLPPEAIRQTSVPCRTLLP